MFTTFFGCTVLQKTTICGFICIGVSVTGKPGDNSLSYGRYLRQCRLEKGVSIEALSRELKVTVELLTAMENEDHTRFPAEVYTCGFLRAFARAVGADEEIVTDGYKRQAAAFNNALDAENSLKAENALFWKKTFVSGLALLLVICLTLLFMSGNDEKGHGTPVTNQPVSTAKHDADHLSDNHVKSNTNTTADSKGLNSTTDVNTSTAGEKLVLDIETVEDTWIKIITDRQKPREYSLRPGDRLSLKAEKGFNVLIGNATGVRLFLNKKPVPITGVRLFLNKKPVPIEGEPGQVVSLEIP
ncbi:MAG: hypothetical protein B5M56_06805 [Desulfococcus sp. 4484_241]|nr:MAG: hypothetical protein B5M56_06805 [Desulfococcus sp. 4484_241]